MTMSSRCAVKLLFASIVFALGLNVFLLPSQIVAGGFSGVAVVLNVLFGVPTGLTVIMLNIPFLILNAKYCHDGKIMQALIGAVSTGTFAQLFSSLEPVSDDRVFNAAVGGVVVGAAMGLIFSLGYTTGGTDLAAALIVLKSKRIGIAGALMLCDLLVVSLSLFVRSEIEEVFLGLLGILSQTLMIETAMKQKHRI